MRSPSRYPTLLTFLVAGLLAAFQASSLRGESADSGATPAWAFTTGPTPAYHLRILRQQPSLKAVVAANSDGSTACFGFDGRPLWAAKGAGGFPFDLATADIDGDRLDEVLVASGDGSLYAYDQDGTLLWRFESKAPLYQVCTARDRNGATVILTGGVEQVLFALSPKGVVLNRLETKHCIRHLRAGDVLGNGGDSLAMATASSGLSGSLRLFLIDPQSLAVVWEKAIPSGSGIHAGKRFFSMLVDDLDKDGKAEVLMGGGWKENGSLQAFNHKGDLLFSKDNRKIPNIPYRMSLLRKITLPNDSFIIGHFGHLLIVYETDGRLREIIAGPYSFADSCFDPESHTLFMGGAVSGGTEIYAYRLDRAGWQKAYATQKPHGRLREIEANLATLKRQIDAFKAPSYQPAPKNTLAITRTEVSDDFRHVAFARSITLTQKVDDPKALWCRERDRRMPYKQTAEELVKLIAEKEAAGENTLIWAGHGNAVYFPLSTFEKLLQAGPRHLKGFVFAEMEGIEAHTQEIVETIILPLAELCLRHGKIIFFRNKNIFWNGTCYLPMWSKVLLNDKYREVFVPGLEETNCRSQELSLAARIGLWQARCFARWACRTVTDDANFTRMHEWEGQQVLTHHLRTLVATSSMGASLFLSDIHAGERTAALFGQLLPFYLMLEKGILQIPDPDRLLSCSDFALAMHSPPSESYLRHGMNGHRFNFPEDQNPPMVFNRLDSYWGGSVLPDYDFSAYAMNVRQRTCNFLPELPFGLVPIVPTGAANGGRFRHTLVTDGVHFLDAEGKRHTASEYKAKVQEALKAAAAKLPVLVSGKATWSAVRLDERHLRITLVDPGFLDPAARSVEILFQHVAPTTCVDILSGEFLKHEADKLKVTIPAGLFRIIDLELPSSDRRGT